MDEKTIVPAYAKKDENVGASTEKNNNKKSVKKKSKSRVKLIIFLVIAVIVVAALIFGISFLVRYIKYSKYDSYAKTMGNYGLEKLYDNEKATSYENVTKSEALKIIIASIKNVSKVDLTVHEEAYKNEDWVKFAAENEIITDEEFKEIKPNGKITYIEFVRYYLNAIVKLNSTTLDTSTYPLFTDIENIKSEELYVISDLVAKGVLENTATKLNPNRKLYKGELNKITCDIIEKYNLLVPEGQKFNVNAEKTPDNADLYPYILYGVAKETYEKEFVVVDKDKFQNPVDIYPSIRVSIDSIVYNVENYYNTILNVDYETIDKNTFKEALNKSLLFSVEDYEIDEYIEYVKENKIKLEGSAVTQVPIIYFDGKNNRIRTKIEFKILSSDTTENILYVDLQNSSKAYDYTKKEYSMLVDIKVDKPSKSNSIMYVWDKSLYEMKIDEKIDGIEEKTVERKDESFEEEVIIE